MMDPVLGPLKREEFAAAVAAPFGGARKIIRKHDPYWGIPPGTKIKWEVRAEREVIEEGWAEVEAESKEEAEALAADLDESDYQWDAGDYGPGPFRIDAVEPRS